MLVLIDLVKYWENGTVFSEQAKTGKNAKMRISLSACPKFLKIKQETNFDMGFQRIDIRDRSKKDGFFLSGSQMLLHSNEPKKNFNKLPSWDFFFIILYENTNN